MCLITFAWRVDARTPLLLAANRDEFHVRPTAAADWWKESPEIFGGRDLSQGGGWLALSSRNRLAAVTNVRRMIPPNPAAPSRGALVAGFLRSDLNADEYAASLRACAETYSGFNLLLYDGNDLLHVTNHPEFCVNVIESGIHGISNDTLDTPWPKLTRVTRGLSALLKNDETDAARLLDLLNDPAPAADDELPDTGVGLELERLLSSPFIISPHYGTRCSSVVKFSAAGPQEFFERRYAPDGSITGETQQHF
jgi:uncharacterized protein with NRDE domain